MHIYRIIQAICKHVIAEDALTSWGVAVPIHKPLSRGVVVSWVEVVEPGFGIVAIAAVAEGIEHTYGIGFGTRDRQKLAPCAVLVIYHTFGIVVYYRYDIALRVVKVEEILLYAV